MPISKSQFSQYIRQFKFRELFNEMGWNNDKTLQPIIVDNLTFQLQAVAEKSGFKIYCVIQCLMVINLIILQEEKLKLK